MKAIFGITMAVIMLAIFPLNTAMSQQGSGLQYRPDLEISVWTNKDDGGTFYRGEDLAVYFQANMDCHVLVYEIDTDGNINVLFPDNSGTSTLVTGNTLYRIPAQNANYHMEVGGNPGDEYIYAVASTQDFTGPSWMTYWGYDYNKIENSWIVNANSGRNDALNEVINRLAGENGGQYVSDFTSFYIDSQYRNYFYYPANDYNYHYGSVWIGADYPGCEIFIDGIYYGITPLYIPSILIGGHVVLLYYHGFPCWQDYFWVDYGHYYRFNAAIHYSYVRDIHRGSRYKHWHDWDFGGKDYRRPDRYKEGGGYTYKHPDQILVPSKSGYRGAQIKQPVVRTREKTQNTKEIHRVTRDYGKYSKSTIDKKVTKPSENNMKNIAPNKEYYYQGTVTKKVEKRQTNQTNRQTTQGNIRKSENTGNSNAKRTEQQKESKSYVQPKSTNRNSSSNSGESKARVNTPKNEQQSGGTYKTPAHSGGSSSGKSQPATRSKSTTTKSGGSPSKKTRGGK